MHIWSRNQPKSKTMAPVRNAIANRAPVHSSGSVASPLASGPHPTKYATKVADITRAMPVQIAHFAALIAALRAVHGASLNARCFIGPPSRNASIGRKKNSSQTVCGQA